MYFNCILKVWYYLKKYHFVLNPHIFFSVTDCLIIRMLEMDHFESAWPVRKVFRKTECFRKKCRKLSKFTSNKNHERNLFSQKVGNQLPEVVYEKFLKNVLQKKKNSDAESLFHIVTGPGHKDIAKAAIEAVL